MRAAGEGQDKTYYILVRLAVSNVVALVWNKTCSTDKHVGYALRFKVLYSYKEWRMRKFHENQEKASVFKKKVKDILLGGKKLYLQQSTAFTFGILLLKCNSFQVFLREDADVEKSCDVTNASMHEK